MPNYNNREFIADPFIIKRDNDIFISVEKLKYKKNVGQISFLQVNKNAKVVMNQDNIIPSQNHLSYPFIFEYKNEIYMIPESYEANEISIYKAIDFPKEWNKIKVIIKNFKGVDSTIIKHNEKWWLFTTEKEDGHSYKLKIFFSNDLLGDWFPHNNNPVKMDVRSTRGAGNIFSKDGELYRPSQDYSFASERRIVINCIKKLNEFEFEEIPVYTIDPLTDSPFPDKIHTISSYNDITVIDACKTVSFFKSPLYIVNKLKRVFQR